MCPRPPLKPGGMPPINEGDSGLEDHLRLSNGNSTSIIEDALTPNMSNRFFDISA